MFSVARQRACTHLFEWVAATGEVRQLTSGPGIARSTAATGPAARSSWVAVREGRPAGRHAPLAAPPRRGAARADRRARRRAARLVARRRAPRLHARSTRARARRCAGSIRAADAGGSYGRGALADLHARRRVDRLQRAAPRRAGGCGACAPTARASAASARAASRRTTRRSRRTAATWCSPRRRTSARRSAACSCARSTGRSDRQLVFSRQRPAAGLVTNVDETQKEWR